MSDKQRDKSPKRGSKRYVVVIINTDDVEDDVATFYCERGSLSQEEIRFLRKCAEPHDFNLLVEYAGEKLWDQETKSYLPSTTACSKEEQIRNAKIFSRFNQTCSVLDDVDCSDVKNFEEIEKVTTRMRPYEKLTIYIDPTE